MARPAKPRTLEQLQKQYNSAAKPGAPGGMRRGHGPGGPGGPGGRGMGGKPKDTKKTLGRLFSYMRPYRLRFLLVLLCMLISTATSLLGSYLLAPIVDKLTLAVKPDAAIRMSTIEQAADRLISSLTEALGLSAGGAVMAYLITAVVLLLIVYLVGIATTYLQGRLMLTISQGITERLRGDLFTRLQSLPVRYFDGHPTGEIMSRFTNDIDNIDVMLNNSLTSLVSGTVTLIGTFVFMVTTNWVLTLITVAFVPIFARGGMLIAGRSRKYYSGQQAALGAVNGYMEETVTGQKVIKVFGHEETCVEEFGLLNDDMRDKQFKAQFWGGVMGPIMGNTSQIGYAVTVGVGGVLMCTAGLTPGALTVFANYSRQFSMPINMISQQMSTLFAALAGAERVFEVMDTPPEPADVADPHSTEGLRGKVRLNHVTFGYLPGKTVLRDISLTAEPGQKIAFVGSTGAGKTTITNLLNRFYDIDEGKILIDGTDIREYPMADLRRNIAMVLQDTHLFTGTVMENIRYGRLDATDEDCIRAAKIANAHYFISHLPQGYDTMLTSDGANLSQGQRQLLAIARAAVSEAPVLILDEATSSVDTRTEKLIERGLDGLMKGRTVFVIAHRLSTVRNADAILVLENGRVVERGNHNDLLELRGRYYQLYTNMIELA